MDKQKWNSLILEGKFWISPSILFEIPPGFCRISPILHITSKLNTCIFNDIFLKKFFKIAELSKFLKPITRPITPIILHYSQPKGKTACFLHKKEHKIIVENKSNNLWLKNWFQLNEIKMRALKKNRKFQRKWNKRPTCSHSLFLILLVQLSEK